MNLFYLNHDTIFFKKPEEHHGKVLYIGLKPSDGKDYPDYTIYKTDDEWYMVKKYYWIPGKVDDRLSTIMMFQHNFGGVGKVEVKYYKCDQMSGVIEFLKDEKVI